MALEVETKDCTQLSDTELIEMADLCAEVSAAYEAGVFSKLAESWVLVTLVREGKHLRGFSFSTLERIGGTPAILLGMAHIKRTSRRDAILRAVMAENYRRALMAFPDEDVLVGVRMLRPDAFEAFAALTDINPRPHHKSSGEERAWGRRLAKRFAVDAGFDDKSFVAKGNGAAPLILDHESSKPDSIDVQVAGLFKPLKVRSADTLITFGWMMAEDLLKFGK